MTDEQWHDFFWLMQKANDSQLSADQVLAKAEELDPSYAETLQDFTNWHFEATVDE